MSFVWRTSSIGYPSFFSGETPAHKLGDFFRLLATAAINGHSYTALKIQAESLFGISPHQTETKKAAFQEFGLAYVAPRSNVISLTPCGKQLFDIASTSLLADSERRRVLLLLARALSRSQFRTPILTGSNKSWAARTDVKPYLVAYYLLMKMGGLVTVSELFGGVFGVASISDVPAVAARIESSRRSGIRLAAIEGLPANSGTRENLKIYFMAHLGLNSEIIRDEKANFYGADEQCYELTEAGAELVATVLSQESKNWKRHGLVPVARRFRTVAEYFESGVGAACPGLVFESDAKRVARFAETIAGGVLSPEDVDNLRELPKRSFKEGQKKLTTHARTERSQALVREAKRQFKKLHGRLYCAVCGFEFVNRYGERGLDFIEAHHTVPISTLTGAVPASVSDLELVCSNCHRMLHRSPWISVSELRDSLE